MHQHRHLNRQSDGQTERKINIDRGQQGQKERNSNRKIAVKKREDILNETDKRKDHCFDTTSKGLGKAQGQAQKVMSLCKANCWLYILDRIGAKGKENQDVKCVEQ